MDKEWKELLDRVIPGLSEHSEEAANLLDRFACECEINSDSRSRVRDRLLDILGGDRGALAALVVLMIEGESEDDDPTMRFNACLFAAWVSKRIAEMAAFVKEARAEFEHQD